MVMALVMYTTVVQGPFETEDLDGDTICSEEDNCPEVANPNQLDLDGNGVGDVCQDEDQDGVNFSDDCNDKDNQLAQLCSVTVMGC